MNLSIKDLSASTELDQASMTAVRGGDNGVSATNPIFQVMDINAPSAVAYGPGSSGNTNIRVNGTQNASIWNFQKAGDSYLAFLPFAV
jgi:hypothetical protein